MHRVIEGTVVPRRGSPGKVWSFIKGLTQLWVMTMLLLIMWIILGIAVIAAIVSGILSVLALLSLVTDGTWPEGMGVSLVIFPVAVLVGIVIFGLLMWRIPSLGNWVLRVWK